MMTMNIEPGAGAPEAQGAGTGIESRQGPLAGHGTEGRNGNDTLARLADVIESRRQGDPDKSYVARLFAKGPDAILKKVGEEATEAVMAGKDADPKKIVYEVADLWFHSMLLLAQFDLRPSDVLRELERREGLSGLEEFAARKAVQREGDESKG
jgi:phosphoribosyl-ATP pyrophosphohydrolase